MNIFKKIKLANRIINLLKALKTHFEKNIIADRVKHKVENIISDFQELGDLLPEFKQEIIEISVIIKQFFNI
jgi:hypothetical protein